MRILMTNDDGLYAPGLEALARVLGQSDEVYIVASSHEQSTGSHAITRHKPLRITEDFKDPSWGIKRIWKTNGTPADNVKLGVTLLLSEPPELIISGINRGSNLGRDVYYSGTISAAMEGMFLGIPSLALSLDISDDGLDQDFVWCARFIQWWIHSEHFIEPPPGIFYNLNFPHGGTVPPTRLVSVPLGRREYQNTYIRRVDPQGHEYFWFVGNPLEVTNAEQSDVEALRRGFITLTPIQMDVTASEMLTTIGDFPVPELD
ncbi:MAG: 5'/3'-nucleotidase SurE [Sulfobacillus benefaciens]|uniref:5'-nucleotidase SurE n=1 Tax=Sulfobacillus benefaciens TaxID=453960 RepID=A0A2T2WR71_9FIRM|nr:MAG: 5'/3'-nucleotidase SurE [Sulfobacillus benefaciens]